MEIEEMLAERAQVADAIVRTIDKLGDLLRDELELQDQLRRAAEADGSKANVFATASVIMECVNSELVRVGVSPRRADPRYRLVSLILDQNRRYLSQRAVRAST